MVIRGVSGCYGYIILRCLWLLWLHYLEVFVVAMIILPRGVSGCYGYITLRCFWLLGLHYLEVFVVAMVTLSRGVSGCYGYITWRGGGQKIRLMPIQDSK